MSLFARLTLNRGDLRLDAALTVGAGEVVALLGPNGAGKSTLLQLLAGTLRPDDGRVELNGTTLDDVAAGSHVRPRERRVGMVVQDYLLFPRMSVLENVAFGLRSRGVAREPARRRAREWLDRVGLGGYERRRPGELSGGQAQRVALARALIVEPRLLLLDEPLAALDAGTRPAVRAELRRHLAGYGGCTVVVTHDPLEAMVLGDRVVVLERGTVVQEGQPAEVARRPRTDYVARLVGLNLLRGVADGRVAELPTGATVALAHDAFGPVHVAFAPVAVTLSPRRPEGSARNAWELVITDLEAHGDLVRVTTDGPVSVLADVTPLAVADLRLEPGSTVWASVKATEINVYPA
ncbi:ABC transporter ATP-binding protein [Jiangella asiatica]|uniref:ABC transporter ATP-binding protein n=1 Tax=Jiangella asiatica TaxID=2530372 RepID=A0A4R5DB95_9ACTN|nr:ABC transporter ATP-binding protein [Jiangella asiatica]TDE09081.1 ABC transporter ATP-binding protein [Jiangella asiatica]